MLAPELEIHHKQVFQTHFLNLDAVAHLSLMLQQAILDLFLRETWEISRKMDVQ
jgi:hypothetical protein